MAQDGAGEQGVGDAEQAIDPFFEFVPETDWNACVERQGHEENYVDGFMEAARRLVALVMDSQLMASRDTLVLPILYNARHAVELALKFASDRLHGMGAIASRHPVNHDILSHWRHLDDAKVGDERIRGLLEVLRPYVVSLAGIDDDGQQLRYPQDRDGNKSLDGLAVVNLRLIRRSLDGVAGVLGALRRRAVEMGFERETGTFTDKCSRADLKAIAGMVGPRSDWGDAGFDARKAAVRKRFGLGSRDCGKALDAIQKSRELAALIGVETPLCHLSDDKAVFALERWAEAHPPYDGSKADLGIDVLEPDWDEMERWAKASRQLDDAIISNLSVEDVSDLEAVFYVGRDGELGETYELAYRYALDGNRKERNAWVYVHHVMSKTNLLDALVRGCGIVGRPSLAARLRAIRPAD